MRIAENVNVASGSFWGGTWVCVLKILQCSKFYCRNMAMQHGGPHGRGPTPSVDIKGSFEGNENTTILSYTLMTT